MKEHIFVRLYITVLLFAFALSAAIDQSLVVSSKESSNDNGEKESSNNLPEYPVIYEMDITANISNRFAKTLVVSKVKNSQKSAKEATFSVVLPETAFISEFIMEIGGKSYKAYVKEKEEAKEIYNAAVNRGQSAAHVSVSARDSNRFTVSVNIEAESKATFLLTYEELLQRRDDRYELVINIHPGQIVKHLNVKVQVNESRPLKFVKTPSLRSGNEISKNNEELDPSSDIQIINSTTAVVKFAPGPEKQKQFARGLNTKESEGLSGQFIVQYDIERDPYGGEVLLEDGYFVHFFAPSDLEPLPKHVVFVLDTSGSMSGRRILQLKDAMKSILKEMKKGDLLNIIEFNSDVHVWDITTNSTVTLYDHEANYEDPFPILKNSHLPAPTVATEENLENAKGVVEGLRIDGLTNIIGGLETGLYLVKVGQEGGAGQPDKKHQPIIIFLTDGAPNVGVSSTEEIVKIVTRLNSNNNNVPIYSLSFGYSGNKEFLRKLSLKNHGFSRHIYEASDASLQLQDFFRQISSPLLTDIKFKYNSGVKEVTKSTFPIYHRGSELVVTGRYYYKDLLRPLEAHTDCFGFGLRPKILTPTIEKPVTSLERLWAYLTVKQALEERELTDNKTELTKKALDLALKYSFVTDITSLVVVKPNDTKAVDTEEAGSDIPGHDRIYGGVHHASLAHSGSSALFSPRTYAFSALPGPPQPFGLAGLPGPRQPYGLPGLPGISGIRAPPTTSKPKLEDSLPWLASVLNPNGTITIAQGVYELGENSAITTGTDCPKTPINNSTETGMCSLLKNCPQVHSSLTDFQVYQQYFCPISNTLAGVCCPKKSN